MLPDGLIRTEWTLEVVVGLAKAAIGITETSICSCFIPAGFRS